MAGRQLKMAAKQIGLGDVFVATEGEWLDDGGEGGGSADEEGASGCGGGDE